MTEVGTNNNSLRCKLWLRRAQSSVSRLTGNVTYRWCSTGQLSLLNSFLYCSQSQIYCCYIVYKYFKSFNTLISASLVAMLLSLAGDNSPHCTGQNVCVRVRVNAGLCQSHPPTNVNINWPRYFFFLIFSFCMKGYIGEGLPSSKKLRHRQLSLGKFSVCFFPRIMNIWTWITIYFVISIGSKILHN